MNMKLIDPSDPLYFRQTSDEPYDRHHYKLELSNGDYVIFEDYEQLRACWFQSIRNWKNSIVTVLDIPDKKTKKSNGGFK